MSLATLVKPGDTLRLAKIETERDAGLSRKQVAEQLEELAGQLAELQELLYAARQHSFLIILQGMERKPRTLAPRAGGVGSMELASHSRAPRGYWRVVAACLRVPRLASHGLDYAHPS